MAELFLPQIGRVTAALAKKILVVILRSRIAVHNHCGDGRAKRKSFEHAGKDLRLVALLAGRRPTFAGTPALKLTLQKIPTPRDACRTAFDNGAHCRAVTLAKCGDRENAAESITTHTDSPRSQADQKSR